MIKLSSNLEILVKRSASPLQDYALYGGGGALAGAGVGALVNALRGKSVGKGALIGGGLGGLAGLGTRGAMDYLSKQRSEDADRSMTDVEDVRARRAAEQKTQNEYDAGIKTLEERAQYGKELEQQRQQEADAEMAAIENRVGNILGGKKIREMTNPLNNPQVQKATDTANKLKEVAERLSYTLPATVTAKDLERAGIANGALALAEFRAQEEKDRREKEVLERLLLGKPTVAQGQGVTSYENRMNRGLATPATIKFGPERDARIAAQTQKRIAIEKAREAQAKRDRQALDAIRRRGIK